MHELDSDTRERPASGTRRARGARSRRHRGHVVAAFSAGLGIGAWAGSQITLRRIRFFKDPANRLAFEQRYAAGGPRGRGGPADGSVADE